MFRKAFFTAGLLLSVSFGFAQTAQSPKIESPTAASLGKFGEIPVSLFTGTPDISIPIHTVSAGKIQVPITLKYHPASVKPTSYPGWVGLGWSLPATGQISRRARGTDADENCDVNNGQNYPAYFPCSQNTSNGASVVNDNADWYSDRFLYDGYSTPQGTQSLLGDIQADEFSFTVLGHSGSFYYSGPAKGWQVVSDENIKVEINGFYGYRDIYNMVIQSGANANYIQTIPPEFQSRYFKGFTLTVPDGTKFIFGGHATVPGLDAVELSSAYDGGSIFYCNTWMLKKIIDVNNNEILFNYSRIAPTCRLGFSEEDHHLQCGTNPPQSTSSASIQTNRKGGSLIWPVYLSAISSVNEIVEFTSGQANCLRFSDNTLKFPVAGNGLAVLVVLDANYNTTNNTSAINKIQWQKLEKIAIKKNAQSPATREIFFTYHQSPDEHLMLTSINEQPLHAGAGDYQKKYSFAYNPSFSSDRSPLSPPLYDGSFTDHWGYYNGIDVDGKAIQNIYQFKVTVPSAVIKCLLNKITYPAKGYTELDWEAHDFSAIVSNNRSAIPIASSGISGNPYAGGTRIRVIRSYTETGVLAFEKKYYYKKGYASGADLGTLSSSGVLNGVPRYAFSFTNRQGNTVGTLFNGYFAELNSFAEYSFSGQGSPVGYDEVVEVNKDGSYTKNYFTSFGADYNNITHLDQPPVGKLGWVAGEDVYMPFSSLENERGKNIALLHYRPDNILVEKTVFTYRNDAGRFNSYIRQIQYQHSFGSCTDHYSSLLFATATKVFQYNYYPIKKEVTLYNQEGNNPVVQTTLYTYNNDNLVKTQQAQNSKGENITTTYKYPSDYPGDAALLAMANAHILSPVIESAVSNSNSGQLTLTKTNYYSPSAGIYVPQNVQVQVGNNPIETRQQFYRYDNKGNLLEHSKADDVHEVILWGYGAQYPVAKITGAIYTQVEPYITPSILEAPADDNQIRSMLNTIRTGLPLAMVTTYTYNPLLGVTSITDARGKTVFYEYDIFQRLQLVKDQDANVIKTYDYKYKQ